MQEIIISMINQFGYLGITLLIAIENIFPPIPSEVILCFSGFMTSRAEITILGVIIASTIGAIAGAILLYYIGRILNKDRLIKIISGKIGKVLRLKAKDVEMADTWFSNKGNITVLICRCIPIVRSLISIPAGMNKMPFAKFMIYTVIGTVVWNTVLTYLGSVVGESWENIAMIIDKYSTVTLIVLVVGFIGAVVWFYKKRLQKEGNKE